jgi:hypothetical protein
LPLVVVIVVHETGCWGGGRGRCDRLLVGSFLFVWFGCLFLHMHSLVVVACAGWQTPRSERPDHELI